MDINHVNDIVNKLDFTTKQPILEHNIYDLLYSLNDINNSYLNLLPKEILKYMIDNYLYNSNIEMTIFKLPKDLSYDYFDEFKYTIKTSQYYFIYGMTPNSTILVIIENIDTDIKNLFKNVYCIKDSNIIDNKYIGFSSYHPYDRLEGTYFVFLDIISEYRHDVLNEYIFDDLYIVPLYKND